MFETPAEESHTLRDGQGWAPLITQDVKANAAIRVDVGVVDPGCEMDFWRLERIVRWELDLKEENTPGIRRFALHKRLAFVSSESRRWRKGCRNRTANSGAGLQNVIGTYQDDSQDP